MKKYNVGYTTGVFDLFHIGHLNLLRNAKEYCKYLVVGVSTDELVREYKNKDTIIPFHERKTIVEAVRYVDRAVAQESMVKMKAWDNIRFDAIFVGDDWKGHKNWIKFEQQFKEVGVDIVYLPYTKQTSSTVLRELITKSLVG